MDGTWRYQFKWNKLEYDFTDIWILKNKTNDKIKPNSQIQRTDWCFPGGRVVAKLRKMGEHDQNVQTSNNKVMGIERKTHLTLLIFLYINMEKYNLPLKRWSPLKRNKNITYVGIKFSYAFVGMC